MKRMLFLCLMSLNLLAWSVPKAYFIEKYRPKLGEFKTLSLPMAHNTDSFLIRTPGKALELIYRIDYVATSNSENLTDYQKSLDKKRWNTMFATLGIDKTGDFERRIYYQTNHTTLAEEQALFHGFVIYFRESSSELHKASIVPTTELMNRLCGKTYVPGGKDLIITPSKRIDSVYFKTILPSHQKVIEKELLINNQVLEWSYDSIGRDKKLYGAHYILSKVSPALFAAFMTLSDRSLMAQLERNKIKANALIATDMTGSMYPYYSQLLVWHALKLSQGKKYNYVFFNDGDQKNQTEKIVGKTGGIYTTRSSVLNEVYDKMHQCLKGGHGGDLPENNFEAVIYGLAQFEKIDQIILICDNNAVPRDTDLLKQIKQPIDFVMCGTYFGVNAKYLELARQNNGNVMTMEKSLKKIGEIKAKQSFVIGEKTYQFKDGSIQMVK